MGQMIQDILNLANMWFQAFISRELQEIQNSYFIRDSILNAD